VTAIKGPDGKTASTFGLATSWAVTKKANAPASEQFVQYMMSTGYLPWLGMAPEGKFPLRTGDASNPTKYTDGWKTLQTGVDTKATLSSIYDSATMAALQKIPSSINTWAIPQGQGSLLGAVETQLTVPQVIGNMGAGSLTPAKAATTATDAVNQAKSKLK
jgi:multiple sugar transport system substrate-binding protein